MESGRHPTGKSGSRRPFAVSSPTDKNILFNRSVIRLYRNNNRPYIRSILPRRGVAQRHQRVRGCRVISVDLYARVRNSLLMHTRPRVHRAPGIPARPPFGEAAKLMANLEQSVLRECEPVSERHSVVSASLRGALATKQSTLACFLAARWIASLTLAMTLLDVRARHAPMSSPGLTGRPVLRGANDGIDKPRRTGSPACAGDDDRRVAVTNWTSSSQ